MQVLKRIKTKFSPEVFLDPSGIIRLKGRSILENAAEFYDPVFEWMEEYIKNPAPHTCFDIELEYFNSATAKSLISLIQVASGVTFKNADLKINWFYEDGDDDILERGEYIESVLEADFNFIKIKG